MIKRALGVVCVFGLLFVTGAFAAGDKDSVMQCREACASDSRDAERVCGTDYKACRQSCGDVKGKRAQKKCYKACTKKNTQCFDAVTKKSKTCLAKCGEPAPSE